MSAQSSRTSTGVVSITTDDDTDVNSSSPLTFAEETYKRDGGEALAAELAWRPAVAAAVAAVVAAAAVASAPQSNPCINFWSTHSFCRATRRRCFLLASCSRREYLFGHDTPHNPQSFVIVGGGFPPFPQETSPKVEGAAGYNVCSRCELSNNQEVL